MDFPLVSRHPVQHIARIYLGFAIKQPLYIPACHLTDLESGRRLCIGVSNRCPMEALPVATPCMPSRANQRSRIDSHSNEVGVMILYDTPSSGVKFHLHRGSNNDQGKRHTARRVWLVGSKP